ncbi:MAG: SH3 domain-containing protein [Sarcina sp.]
MKKKILTAIITVGLITGIGSVAQSKELDNIDAKNKTVVEIEANKDKAIQKGKVINVTSNLRVRQTASTSGAIVGHLYGGDVVNITGKSGNWYEVQINGGKGFVSSDYISIIGNETVVEGKDGEVINVSTSLRLRKSPSISAEIIGTLRNGERFKILEKSNGWYKINRDNQIGYIHGDYVRELGNNTGGNTGNDGNEAVKPETEQKLWDGKVINVSTSLRVRSDASTSASILGNLYAGNKVEVYGQKNGWYKIKFNDKFGYVHGDYVAKADSNTGNESIKPEESDKKLWDGKVVNVSTSLRVRSDASTSASVLGNLYGGNIVEVYGQKNGWYKIKFSGKFGYVHGDYIVKADSSTGNNNGGSNENNSGSETNKSKYDTVLNEMKNHLGTPYVYGGAGEIISDSLIASLQKKFPGQQYSVSAQYKNGNYRAFDCSGLMQWGFKKAGITLGRTTYDQVKAGVGVSKSNIKPGDLVFYSDLNHVGMYVGNDQWIEAPRTGSPVRITEIPWSKIGQIRRVL